MNGVPASAAEKFARAQEHFDSLKREVDAFLEPDAHRTRSEPNSDFTEYRFFVEFNEPLPLVRWGLIFGDGVHCLRSALDHSVYAIGVIESGTDPPPDERILMFPITADQAAWKDADGGSDR